MKSRRIPIITRLGVAVGLLAALVFGHICLPWEHHAALAAEAQAVDLDADRHQPHPESCSTAEPARVSDQDTNPGVAAPGAALVGVAWPLLTPGLRGLERLVPDRPPLFLLHAALLI